MILDLLADCVESRRASILYSPRKLLVEQTIQDLDDEGFRFGVRASGHKDRLALLESLQISTFSTERARVYQSKKWELHESDVTIVDEAHIAGSVAEQIIADHELQGCELVIGLTATPIGIHHLYDRLETVGTNSECRRVGAIVPAWTYAIDEPEMKKVTRRKDGEYIWKGKRKEKWLHRIVGRVIAHWKLLNPEQKPTVLFAPGLRESVWFVKQFENAGVRALHMDGQNVYYDGKSRSVPDAKAREKLLDGVRCGDFKVVCNRFVLREGINVRELAHCILATPIGSLVSYVQAVGRVLRACPEAGLDHVKIQDHGGLWWRHGSANMDRNWAALWDLPPGVASYVHMDAVRKKAEPQPRLCPNCKMVVSSRFGRCQGCGHERLLRGREVVQADGSLQLQMGDPIKPPASEKRHDTEKEWERIFWAMKNAKKPKTFRQAIGLFRHTHGYEPPRDLRFMPTSIYDWYRAVHDVPMSELRGWRPPETKPADEGSPTLF